MRSDGYLSDPDETDLDEDPIVEDDPAKAGEGDFTSHGDPEPLDAYTAIDDFFGERVAKRRKLAE